MLIYRKEKIEERRDGVHEDIREVVTYFLGIPIYSSLIRLKGNKEE